MEVREWSEVGFRRQTEALQAASGELEVRRMRLLATYDARDCGGVSHAGGSECCSQPEFGDVTSSTATLLYVR